MFKSVIAEAVHKHGFNPRAFDAGLDAAVCIESHGIERFENEFFDAEYHRGKVFEAVCVHALE
ncbi:MAG: hypothetical protein MJK04_03755, partial [Psychrosphaera sp.]|nr:hypothetical protein [Psychrosphaera sp.]